MNEFREPWQVGIGDNGENTILSAEANTIAWEITNELDARRIVACVNILKGIPTERLEGMLEKGGCFGLSVFPNDPKYQAPGLPKTLLF